MKQDKYKNFKYFNILFILLLFTFVGCRYLKMELNNRYPKQGDLIEVKIEAGDSWDLEKVKYRINDIEGDTTTIPYTVSLNTCKSSGEYVTKLTIWGEAIYRDGEVFTFQKEYDLTECDTFREDQSLTYGIYVSHDEDAVTEELFLWMSTAVINEFNSYSKSQYYWAHPSQFTWRAAERTNSVDLTIAFGHGNATVFAAGINDSDIVDISDTSYGGFVPCLRTGDLEYLVFGSCSVLSMVPYGRKLHYGGRRWGSGYHVTSIAFGNVDNDEEEEVGIARFADINARFVVLDDKTHGFRELYAGGADWGSDLYATSITFGDVDGDGKDEVGVGIRAVTGARYLILDDKDHDFQQLHAGGTDWLSGVYATSIDFGDVDGDGKDEVGVGIRVVAGPRYLILDDNDNSFQQLYAGGNDWGPTGYTTSIAFGNVDDDVKDEVGIARHFVTNERFWILDDKDNDFQQLHAGGTDWLSGVYATSIDFGDVDGDGKDEVGVGIRVVAGARYLILDDNDNSFQQLHAGGNGWGPAAYATSIAFGDVDNDGKDEVGIARYTNTNQRYWVFDDKSQSFREIYSGGRDWQGSDHVTSIAFGDVNNNNHKDIGFGFSAREGTRYQIVEGRGLGRSFWYGWFHQWSTKFENRPFSGLHMVLGFRTLFSLKGNPDQLWESDGVKLFEEFSNNLDAGMYVIDAWQESIGDTLSFDDGYNRGAVIYLGQYSVDRITSNDNDIIYKNDDYGNQWIDFYVD